MKTLLIISLLALTGCAGSKYTAGDFAMAFLAAKANSNSTQNAYNYGMSAGQPTRNMSVINQIDLQNANPTMPYRPIY
jgi:hypothetical protein